MCSHGHVMELCCFFSPDIFSVKWPKLVLKCVSYLGKLTHEMQHFSRFLECKTVYMQLIVSDDVYITKKNCVSPY